MTPLEEKIRKIARAYKPKGWKVIERLPKHGCDGMALWTRVIYCLPLINEYALYVYFHELGHVYGGDHLHEGRNRPTDPPYWQIEYEAEQWACSAMRANGFAVSRDMLQEARDNVAYQFRLYPNSIDVDDEECQKAIKFAHPDTWRDMID